MGKLARRLALAATVSLLAMTGTAWAESKLSFHAGVEYFAGEYGGDQTTEVIAVPFGVRLTVDEWTLRASASYLDVMGPADIADGGEVDGGSSGTFARDGSDTGISDTTISLERAFRHMGGTDVYTEFNVSARLPTGDETKGLGTGVEDYGVNAEIGVANEGGSFYVSAGYRFLGERDTGPQREDGAQAAIGAWLPIGNRTRVGAFGTWRKAAIEGNDDPALGGAYVSYRMSERMRVTFTASGGLSDASPEYMTGIRFNWLPGGLNE